MKLCVLEVNASGPNENHKSLFMGNTTCDFFYVTFKTKVDDKYCLKYCPKTHWSQTRNALYKLVPKEYDYYMFIDDDILLRSNTTKNPIEQIINDLNKYKPAMLTPVYNVEKNQYPIKNGYYTRLFSNNCVKIIHKSLLNWLLPYNNDFGGSWSACHFINFLEIPFVDYNIVTMQVEMINPISSGHDRQNNNMHMKNMEKIWRWFKSSFKKIWSGGRNCLDIKHHYQKHCTKYNPPINNNITNFLDKVNVEDYFNLNHEFFKKYRSFLLNNNVEQNFIQNNINSNVENVNDELDKLNKLDKKKTLIIMGNGPSMKKEYFEILRNLDVDTFGMNAAYRYWDKINWYPTYYCCYDYAITHCHKETLTKMILDENISIKRYFLLEKPTQKSNLKYTTRYFPEEIREHPKYFEKKHNKDFFGYTQHPDGGNHPIKYSSTGCGSIRTGIEMGYKNIILLGMDGHYKIQCMPYVTKETDYRVVLKKTPEKNPNYFWDGYQQAGDIYHVPGNHLMAWNELVKDVKKHKINVINCSIGSKIRNFQMDTFENIVKKLTN